MSYPTTSWIGFKQNFTKDYLYTFSLYRLTYLETIQPHVSETLDVLAEPLDFLQQCHRMLAGQTTLILCLILFLK